MSEFCSDCKKDGQALKGLWYAASYAQPLIKQLIKSFKYEGLIEINDLLSHLVWAVLKSQGLPPAWHSISLNKWIISPIPLSNRKFRTRGFNQAELIAKNLSCLSGLNFENSLVRQRHTLRQSRLNDAWRQSNLAGAFILADNINPTSKIYLLVDDVYTSGATMENCARVLKQAGAVEVWGLVVAKG
ncbi:MAG: ComF family protein [Patescibacteria group bacterium]